MSQRETTDKYAKYTYIQYFEHAVLSCVPKQEPKGVNQALKIPGGSF
jgi:hypothetical protein